MSTTWDDIARDMAIQDLHDEAVITRATREQCIFLFVEGECEAIAIPELLYGTIDFDAVGIQIANYNGHGSLKAVLRFMRLTLSFDRPVILTYDNDPESTKSLEACRKQNLISDLVYEFPIPHAPVVTYPGGHQGGSFEESFPPELFLTAAFHETILPEQIRSDSDHFRQAFAVSKPWFPQLQKFCAERNFFQSREKKVELAELMASKVENQPATYVALAKLIRNVRSEHPVKHPDDVVLPKVRGLTA
ncbi:MAG: TOPRIM nucleotidyl transferase/hydrolase domain-containing protein [Candidatus Binatia bacterium]